jgi:hypothetical protein
MFLRLIGKFLAEALINQKAGDPFIQSMTTEIVRERFGLRLLRTSPARRGLPLWG